MKFLWLALRWMACGFKARRTAGFAYTKDTINHAIPYVLAFGLPPEILLEELFIPGRLLGVKLALHIMGVLGSLWLLGYYVSLLESPHTVEGHVVRLRHGALRSAEVTASEVDDTVMHGRLDHRQLRRTSRRAERSFYIDGAPVVELRLRRPLAVGRNAVQRLFVSVDEPVAFCAALQTASTKSSMSASVVR